jgi:hypothetical protein
VGRVAVAAALSVAGPGRSGIGMPGSFLDMRSISADLAWLAAEMRSIRSNLTRRTWFHYLDCRILVTAESACNFLRPRPIPLALPESFS